MKCERGSTGTLRPLVGIKEVKAMTGLSASAIVRVMAEGWFPKAKKVGPRAVRWDESRLLEWIARLPEVRYAAREREAA